MAHNFVHVTNTIPEIIPAVTDRTLISEKRFSHFLLDCNRTIWQHSEHFVNNHSSSPHFLVSSCHSSSLLFELLHLLHIAASGIHSCNKVESIILLLCHRTILFGELISNPNSIFIFLVCTSDI